MSEKANQIKPVRARALMHAYTPKGWKVIMGGAQQPGASGLCDYGAKRIYVPFVCDDYSLGVFFHEVAHAKLHRNSIKPSHQIEYEAEREAHRMLRECGFKVTRFILRAAKEYVASEIVINGHQGIPIDPKVRRWAGKPRQDRW